jgi:subtilisin family serine protease
MDKDQVMVQGMPYIKGAVGLPDRAGPLAIPPASGEGGPRVAILDTDLYAHPGLAGRYLGPAHDFGPEPPDTLGHSVFVAGLIAARAPAAELVVRPVLDADGENASSWDVATQMAAIQAEDVAVLNLSLGCATADRQPPLCLRRAAGLLLPGVVIVASAGNNGSASPLSAAMGLTPVTPIFPAAMDGVIGVGAYQGPAASPEPAPFSPPGVPWVRLLAPGVRVTSTFLSGKVRRMKLDQAGQLVQQDITEFGHPGYATWDGTSFAAAGVSGAIAALMQDRRVSAREALDLILNAQVPGSDIVTA